MHLILGPTDLATELNFTIPLVNIQNNEIKRIGVFVSGGLDSAALLCLICSELKATNRLDTVSLTAFTIVKNEGSTYYAQRIVDIVSKQFNITIEHFNNQENDKDAYHAGRIGSSAIHKIWEDTRHDTLLYMAVNQMAPDNIRPFSQTLKVTYRESNIFRSPFLTLHKPQILDIFYKTGCENVLEYTHSCTVQAVGSCNQCYSCKEREWGFTSLSKEVVGTIDPDIEDISFNGTWHYR